MKFCIVVIILSIITLGYSSPHYSTLPITLVCSEPVVSVPILLFVDASGQVFYTEITGVIPGTSFSGFLKITDDISSGNGIFILEQDTLVDKAGNKGNELLGDFEYSLLSSDKIYTKVGEVWLDI